MCTGTLRGELIKEFATFTAVEQKQQEADRPRQRGEKGERNGQRHTNGTGESGTGNDDLPNYLAIYLSG